MKTFDREAALARVEGDAEFLAELIEMFFEDYPNSISRLERAVASKDAAEIKEAAHSIKSALGNLGAMSSYSAAQALEFKAKAVDLSDSQALLEAIKREVDLFSKEARNRPV